MSLSIKDYIVLYQLQDKFLKKMAGRMGYDQLTLKKVEVVKVDSENSLLYLKGAIPGSRGSLIKVIG